MRELESNDDPEFELRLLQEGEQWRAARANCPDPELLMARGSEALDPAVRERLARHLNGCPHCTRLARDLDTVRLDVIDQSVESRIFARVTSSPRAAPARWLALAAGVVLACGLAMTWWARFSSPVLTVPETVVAPPEQEPQQVALWTVEPAPVRLPLSSLGAPRSGADRQGDAGALLDALAPYRTGRYADGVPLLERLVQEQPANADARFYLGVSLLLIGRSNDAMAALERARELAVADRREETEWYLATAEQRSGRADASRARLAALCARAGAYQTRACAAEAALK